MARDQQQQERRPAVIQPQANKEPSALQQAGAQLQQQLESQLVSMGNIGAQVGISPERVREVVLMQFSRRPELWGCKTHTIIRAVKEAISYGLEPSGAWGAHLVPYGDEAQLVLDYRGLLQLVRRSGELRKVEARVVRQRDQFAYQLGLHPMLEHVPYQPPLGATGAELDPGPMVYTYAVAWLKGDPEPQFDVMSAAEVDAIRARSRAGRNGPWVSDYFEMAKKTVLRRLCKLLPINPAAQQALAREDEVDGTAVDVSPRAVAQGPSRGLLAARSAVHAALHLDGQQQAAHEPQGEQQAAQAARPVAQAEQEPPPPPEPPQPAQAARPVQEQGQPAPATAWSGVPGSEGDPALAAGAALASSDDELRRRSQEQLRRGR